MQVTPSLSVDCDYNARVLRVFANPSPRGWMPIWEEIAQLKTEEEMLLFEFKGRPITALLSVALDENVEEAVCWFWYDMDPERFED